MDAGSVMVAHVYGRASDAHDGPVAAKTRVVRVSRIPYSRVSAVVALAIAVPNRDEHGH